ncbi:hypothetical protein [Mesorhizobium sp. M7A.F.Ca.MR.362.00.0.0]|uniref:hypothetical protein n=1 Tax=Mesorhizobium sp. M7A.F.Ca.MR.362.00.0.0 TaxID=2496779 RepID=UPI000FD34544|nr:hypothetical protein [Mesorhizobium sp. M7A.F.Ca.MR.362.00.0.0]RUU79989.1 hypothetical protein EOC06_13840 [Mesorhizobium sp. M7A.F.Ca.MR.362.00.0.0]
MTDIPEDILEAARAIVKAPIADDEGNSLAYFAGSYTPKAIQVLARAILAERNRCAQIARNALQGELEDAIRTPSTPKRADT